MRKFSLSLLLCVLSSEGMQTELPFRVGFEFQMEGAICSPWSLHQSLQKKEMFFCAGADGKLWRVELDGVDIEYVTEPFEDSYFKKENECVESILIANKVLSSVLSNSGNVKVYIGDWYCELYRTLSNSKLKCAIFPVPFLWEVVGRRIKSPNNWETRWQPQVTIQHPLQATIGLCFTLFKGTEVEKFVQEALPNESLNKQKALAGLIFLQSHELLGITRSYSYPFDDDVFLKTLAVSVIRNSENIEEKSVIDSLKRKETVDLIVDPLMLQTVRAPLLTLLSVLACQEKVEKVREVVGIMQDDVRYNTVLSLLKGHSNKTIDSLVLMLRIFQDFNIAHQFDAKRWTHFMSRRPFSEMLKEVCVEDASREILSIYGNYSRAFKELSGIGNLELKTNYAEQFYESENEDPMDLNALLGYFPSELQGDLLSMILKNGLLSSHMLSSIDFNKLPQGNMLSEALVDEIRLIGSVSYYDAVLASIGSPVERCFFGIEGIKKSNSVVSCDLLSPPFPLDEDDAMGRYRDSEKYRVQRYGSAIVEFRSIQYVKNPGHRGNSVFLTDPEFLRIDIDYLMKLLGSIE